jgi:hypothetical protein
MIGVYIPASDMTDEQYKAIDDELNADGPPAGMKMHSCFREGTKLAVFDVWESQEAFEAFGAKLMPVVERAGLTMSPPQFVEMVDYEVA